MNKLKRSSFFFTEKSSSNLIHLPFIDRSKYRYIIASPFLKEREDKFINQQSEMAQLALEELKRRQLQNTEPIHPLHNFPWEPTFKNLTPEWLCGCLTSQTAVQCLASKKGAYKIMLYFERLKKDIMLKAEIKAKNKNKNSILLLTK